MKDLDFEEEKRAAIDPQPIQDDEESPWTDIVLWSVIMLVAVIIASNIAKW